MAGEQSHPALARIDAALARIEAAAVRPDESAANDALAARHEALRSAVATALGELDAVIEAASA
ncbi:MAG TPA: hypothetical protein PKD92_07050 [Novosphingobium sp.]|nr:hypothetical protein [Novosphingobium sp.]HMP56312.1 hypothetical protein [Novosphingobium sp.]